MNLQSFESKVLHLWMTTRVPLTRASLQFYTGAPRAKVERWLDELVSAEVVEMEADDAGEILYTVRGAARPTSGPTSLGELTKKEQLEAEVRKVSRALVPAKLGKVAASKGDGDKSVVASAALSFFLGPLGWLYAAPLGHAAAGIVGFFLLWKILPSFLFFPLLGLLLPASALAGAYYAWTHKK